MALEVNGRAPIEEGQIENVEKDGIRIYYKSRAIKSTKVVPHFYVYKAVDIETGEEIDTGPCLARERNNENEGPWHRETKQQLAKLFNGENEVFVKNEEGDYRIADILVNDETVIELQNSPMSPEEFYSRNYHYLNEEKEIAWILSEKRAFTSSQKEIIGGKLEHSICNINYSSCPIFYDIEHLELEDIPVFIDLEETRPGFFAQLAHVEEKSYGSFKYSAIFILVKKENLLKRIKVKGIYKDIREKLKKRLWTVEAEHVVNKIKKEVVEIVEQAQVHTLNYNIQNKLSNVRNRAQLEAAIAYFQKQGYNVVDGHLVVLTNEDRKRYIGEIKGKLENVKRRKESLIREVEEVTVPKDLPKFMVEFLWDYIRDAQKFIETELRPLHNVVADLNKELNTMKDERNFTPSLPKIINTQEYSKSA